MTTPFIYVQKTKKLILMKRKSMKGLVSVRSFHIKRPNNVEYRIYKVTKYVGMYFSK